MLNEGDETEIDCIHDRLWCELVLVQSWTGKLLMLQETLRLCKVLRHSKY